MDLPFLYQTRTILGRGARRRLEATKRCTQLQTTRSAASASDRPLNDREQASFFRQKAQEVAAKVNHQAPQTLTRQEQAAFDSLRRLVGQRELKSRLGITPEPERLDTNPDNILALYTPQATHGPPTIEVDSDPESAAEQASQTAQAAEVERLIHEICRRQLHTLATAFRIALSSESRPGDLALWEVLEERVFPLLALLKSSQPPLHARPTQRTTKHHTAATVEASKIAAEKAHATTLLPIAQLVSQLTTTTNQASQPPTIPPLKVLSRYYPAALLLALRLLTKNHPLSLQSHRLFPHLRALGPSSYILGVTAPFYNTHLLLRWSVYSSLSEICDILAEMERSAVDFDRGTHRFLTDLAEERRDDLAALEDGGGEGQVRGSGADGSWGTRQPGWWLLPEQQRWWPSVEAWRGKVAHALEEKGMGVVQREGPEGYGDGRRGTPFEGVAPQVWL
jgi:hypothetical protein